MSNLITNWPAPANIKALTTLRTHGNSQVPYDGNNLGLHVGDNPDDVQKNRQDLISNLALPSSPVWLEQTHSNRCIIVDEDNNRQADAAITRRSDQVLAIMTADCLPIVVCNQQGNEIAAIHAGWKGLVNGVIENTLEKMTSKPHELMAWVGPCICPSCYEVGDDVFDACLSKHDFAADAFQKHQQKWLANLPLLAELILQKSSVSAVFHAHACTFERKKDFYSYRREPQTGRMATLIWL